jgi:cation diffusion facilitator family transporter
VMITLSAIIAGYESIMRLIHPQPIERVGWVALAGLLGFIGNEWVALYRIRVGRCIGSAALVADGLHARTDGFTSLAVLVGAAGVALGFALADPIIGLVITVAILAVLRVVISCSDRGISKWRSKDDEIRWITYELRSSQPRQGLGGGVIK